MHTATGSWAATRAGTGPRVSLRRGTLHIVGPTKEHRLRAHGKFFYRGHVKHYLRGVTYGTFAPNRQGDAYPEAETVAADLRAMRGAGINAVRTYDEPPAWLLDLALEHGMDVVAGIPWPQHVAFLDDRRQARAIVQSVAAAAARLAAHPAVAVIAVGNEIPASVIRWYGPRRVERFLERLADDARQAAPETLITYVNYPSTEYLELPFVDVLSFNVFLERGRLLEPYLARLQTLAEDRPLLLTELGLDSRKHGEDAQAHLVDTQIRRAYEAGAAGTFVFSWTDEWHRGGHPVEEWDFGLVDRERRPKAALAAVRSAYRDAPFPPGNGWPAVSVVVCTHNGTRTLNGCLDGLTRLEYPSYEVIVVDDGSTDASANVAAEYDARVIRTENHGLASARNTGLAAAKAPIVAYIDDDAYPDPHWLRHLVFRLLDGDHAGVGGPNLLPPSEPDVARCVANAPGGPIHVLLSDTEAEHIPGCNMAFRKDRLDAIGGFDAQFRIAGDDVDVCWRLQESGWTLGYSAAAVVWHHRRATLRRFWRQQREYGRAEALLERKWPARYNAAGHLSWTGRIYSRPLAIGGWARRRIHYGIWGTGAFQVAEERPTRLQPLRSPTPELYLAAAALGALGALGVLWRPMLVLVALAVAVLVALVAQAAAGARSARFTQPRESGLRRVRLRALTGLLFLVQPLARLRGRLGYGLTPWRRRGPRGLALPVVRSRAVWSETWHGTEARLAALAAWLRRHGAVVGHGGPYDRWELDVRGGPFAGARVRMAIEEHGEGKQYVRFRVCPRVTAASVWLLALLIPLAVVAGAAGGEHGEVVAAILGALALVVCLVAAKDAASATASLLDAIEHAEIPTEPGPPPEAAADGDLQRALVLRRQPRARAEESAR